MDFQKLKEERISDNKKVAEKIVELCTKYDLRFMQMIDNLNHNGDFFYEEPHDTLQRLKDFEKKNENAKD